MSEPKDNAATIGVQMTDAEKARRLEYARSQFEQAKAYASYWQAMAVTGVATNRKISKAGVELTDEEKIREALETSLRHIHRMQEISETIWDLMDSEK